MGKTASRLRTGQMEMQGGAFQGGAKAPGDASEGGKPGLKHPPLPAVARERMEWS